MASYPNHFFSGDPQPWCSWWSLGHHLQSRPQHRQSYQTGLSRYRLRGSEAGSTANGNQAVDRPWLSAFTRQMIRSLTIGRLQKQSSTLSHRRGLPHPRSAPCPSPYSFDSNCKRTSVGGWDWIGRQPCCHRKDHLGVTHTSILQAPLADLLFLQKAPCIYRNLEKAIQVAGRSGLVGGDGSTKTGPW